MEWSSVALANCGFVRKWGVGTTWPVRDFIQIRTFCISRVRLGTWYRGIYWALIQHQDRRRHNTKFVVFYILLPSFSSVHHTYPELISITYLPTPFGTCVYSFHSSSPCFY